ncbi:hypothetical protein B0T16DRAFT_457755 [Cercophora newfieldiana]|uniref:ATP-dependent RNA helicase DHX8 n=1 Tax=Cercophora newfieldiana TaxID=92897 RepID=A0AA39Y6H0_9PEZI|nr:hypothetical protein B0T16DRAFT_457755 [Cercophora newfieldiana]
MAPPSQSSPPSSPAKPKTQTKPPYRQIRALYTPSTITVYQAYKTSIATAAVTHQKLSASPHFRTTRMTWIKPSWSWMLYRAGYSYKDPGQERILALTMKHADFLAILEKGVATKEELRAGKLPEVRIQWDPERTVRLGRLEHRSIQIGIPAGLSERWVEEMIVGIDDVTEKARELKRVLDERPEVTNEELVELGLVPVERPFEISEELQRGLRMVEEEGEEESKV